MSIRDLVGKIKGEDISFDKEGRVESPEILRKLFLAIVIILTASLSFGVGRLSVGEGREPVRIEYDREISNSQFSISNQGSNPNVQTNQVPASGAVQGAQTSVKIENSKIENSSQVVVSKNGTKYHFLHCSGAKQIKEENKVYFATPSAAESAGYTLALNCKPK